MHLLQLLILKTVLLRTAALQLPCPPRRIGPLAASPVCELHDDGPDYVTNAAATLTRAGLNTPAADALVIRGIDAEEEGETIEALEAYEGAVELDPNHPAALFRLGALNVQFGLVEDARDLFHRALDADPDHSAAAACLHLLQDVDATELDAQHAASIEAALADYDPVNYEMDLVPVEVARRSAVKRIPRFLTDAEIDELTATAAVVEAEVGAVARPTRGGGWSTVYLNAELGRRLPWLRDRIFDAASAADDELWGGVLAGKAVNLRCAEYHTVTPPGNLAFERHYDHGSLVTIDIMLSDSNSFSGGAFETSEPGDYLLEHPFEKGDLLLFLSHKYHCVSPVTRGTRNVLVAELWEGDERIPEDGRCDQRHGVCAPDRSVSLNS
jgi:hypothetical protein